MLCYASLGHMLHTGKETHRHRHTDTQNQCRGSNAFILEQRAAIDEEEKARQAELKALIREIKVHPPPAAPPQFLFLFEKTPPLPSSPGFSPKFTAPNSKL